MSVRARILLGYVLACVPGVALLTLAIITV